MVDNSLDAAILSVDGHGGKQGVITIGYDPCDAGGNIDDDADIPEDLLVKEPKELVGKENVYFKIKIEKAINLPM